MSKLLFSMLLFLSQLSFAQVSFETTVSVPLESIPDKVRIENCGIYALSSFVLDNDGFLFSSFNSQHLYHLSKTGTFTKTGLSTPPSTDIVTPVLRSARNAALDVAEAVHSVDIWTGIPKALLNDGGILSADGLEKGRIAVTRSQLSVRIPDLTDFSVAFPNNDLGYADLIGVDASGNFYLVVETYRTEMPLSVYRYIYTTNKQGNVLSILSVPVLKYLTTIRDFRVDEKGNLYHFISDQNHFEIVKISGLSFAQRQVILYPERYQRDVHFNYFTSTQEAVTTVIPAEKPMGRDRLQTLKTGESYVLHRYKARSVNLAPNGATAPDGDQVKTPSWLVVGDNGKIPYKWGGFHTVAQFDQGLLNNQYAGDINTAGITSHAVGVDCSGFVSRCWGLTYHATTSAMPGISYAYASWDLIRPGDAVLKSGHVRLFINKNPNGSLRIVESSARDWGVAYWSYSLSDLTTYGGRYYISMESEFSLNQPEMLSASYDTMIRFSWTNDTTDVAGYRLYASYNGESWSKIADESQVQTQSFEYMPTVQYNYVSVRVASVSRSTGAESNWSTAMGASIRQDQAQLKVLIVDGYERYNGSWQGASHTFTVPYLRALSADSLVVTTVRNSHVANGAILLSEYDAVFWLVGDESTAQETFSATEQEKIISYLEGGGAFFTSGGEIGYDLDFRGTASDKLFYNEYLKSKYLADNAGSALATGVPSGIFNGLSFSIGQTYEEDYPDEVTSFSGSSLVMNYGNNKGAGVAYYGTFGTSPSTGAVICLGFPLETTANYEMFSRVIKKASEFFRIIPVSVNDSHVPAGFALQQNFPNPFNPATEIRFSVPMNSYVSLALYDILGREVMQLVHGELASGTYSVTLNASQLASGTYFYTLKAGDNIQTHKLTLLK